MHNSLLAITKQKLSDAWRATIQLSDPMPKDSLNY
jgi:hypothetical protein